MLDAFNEINYFIKKKVVYQKKETVPMHETLYFQIEKSGTSPTTWLREVTSIILRRQKISDEGLTSTVIIYK